MSLSSLLIGSIQVERKTSTQDASLGESTTWTADSSVPALVQPVSAKERLLFMQRGVQVSHYIYLDQSISATFRDRIRDLDTNKIYRVVQEFNMGGQSRAFRIEVLEMAE